MVLWTIYSWHDARNKIQCLIIIIEFYLVKPDVCIILHLLLEIRCVFIEQLVYRPRTIIVFCDTFIYL